MESEYKFLPGQGSHYSGEIRSFVLRRPPKLRTRRRPIVTTSDKIEDRAPTEPLAEPKCCSLTIGENALQRLMDPFQTSSIHLSQGDDYILRHCKVFQHVSPTSRIHFLTGTVIDGSLSYVAGRRRREAFFPPRDITWPFVREDEANLSTALLFGAMELALLQPSIAANAIYAEQYHLKTMQILLSRIQAEMERPSDQLIHALIGLLAVDTHVRYEISVIQSPTNVDLHVRGLRAVLDARHGWNLSRYPSVIQWDLQWQDLVVKGKLSAMRTEFSTHIRRRVWPRNTLPLLHPVHNRRHWNHLCMLEFAGAYTAFHELATRKSQTLARNPTTLYAPELCDLFSPGTPAFLTLQSDEGTILKSMAPLLLLNIVLFDQQNLHPEEAAYQYWAMRRKFFHCDVQFGSGPAYLTWAIGMTPDMRAWVDPKQIELLSRMLSVEARLSANSRTRLKLSLLAFISPLQSRMADCWNPEDFYDQLQRELVQSGDVDL